MTAVLFWQLFVLILIATVLLTAGTWLVLHLFLKECGAMQLQMLAQLAEDDEVEYEQPQTDNSILSFDRLPSSGM